jgi:hypothetical protein
VAVHCQGVCSVVFMMGYPRLVTYGPGSWTMKGRASTVSNQKRYKKVPPLLLACIISDNKSVDRGEAGLKGNVQSACHEVQLWSSCIHRVCLRCEDVESELVYVQRKSYLSTAIAADTRRGPEETLQLLGSTSSLYYSSSTTLRLLWR